MRQFTAILGFELKKILQRRGIWLALGILVAFQAVSQFVWLFNSNYVNGTFYETHLEGVKKDRENGLKLSGRKLDEELIGEVREAFASIEGTTWPDYMLTEEYEQKIRPYSNVYDTLQVMIYACNGYSELSGVERLYPMRQSALKNRLGSAGLSESEISYWQTKETVLEKPFVYQYAGAYYEIISMSGVYMDCLLLTFFVAICMCGVFTEEHTRKTDQLVLCSRLGRREVYFAKLAAGVFVSLAAALVLLAVTVGGCFAVYGAEGFRAVLQLECPLYSYALTVGQVMLLMIGIFLLAVVVTAVLAMVLSELFRNSIAALSVMIAAAFLERLVPIPEKLRLLGMLWNCLPLNILKLDAGFTDLRLFSLFGKQFTLWQAAPVLYVCAGTALVCLGKRVYARFQVEGR